MSRGRRPPSLQPADLSPAQIRAAIPQLESRIKELEDFHVNSITGWRDHAVVEIEHAITATVARIFGADTLEYDRFKDPFPLPHVGPILATRHGIVGVPSTQQIRQGVEYRRQQAITLLRQQVKLLKEQLGDDGSPNAAEGAIREMTLIADSRLAELRKLGPAQFDLRKLIRLCEEINTAYSQECFFATAMLTRGLLDHVPPLFGKNTFTEVANNYSGAKSFKETMHHLENATRKVADAHLHIPIRKSETLPTAQQVNCAQQLDVLLAEIVRITQ